MSNVSEIPDHLLAEELVARLNHLLGARRKVSPGCYEHQAANVAADIESLLSRRVPASTDTISHESIQVGVDGLGFLGLLNGIVGSLPDMRGGRIAAEYDGERLIRFVVRS